MTAYDLVVFLTYAVQLGGVLGAAVGLVVLLDRATR